MTNSIETLNAKIAAQAARIEQLTAELAAYREAESKPVAFTDSDELAFKGTNMGDMWERPFNFDRDIPLYASPALGQTQTLRDIAIRVVGCISMSGYTPKENSLNPLEALLFDAEKALEAK